MTLGIFRLSSNIRLGELLVQAGVLSKAQLGEATRHAGMKRLQIGQVLVIHGYLTARDLQSALSAQSMIRDRTIDPKQAIRYLKIAHKTGALFDDIIGGLNKETVNRKIITSKLGELLLDARIINSEQLLKAMDKSISTGLPLGRTLVLDQVIPETFLREALDVQVRLRDEMMTREEALKTLRASAGMGGHSDAVCPAAAPLKRGIRLGELLAISGIVNETQIMNALEVGLVNSQPIGVVLVEKGETSQEIIDAALKLQKYVEDGSLTPIEAGECLVNINTSHISVDAAMQQFRDKSTVDESLSYRQLLALARVASHDDISLAIKLILDSPEKLAQLLTITGLIDGETMQATLKCHKLISDGFMSPDDAIVALDYCLNKRPVDFELALQELGWRPPQAEEKALVEINAPSRQMEVAAAAPATHESKKRQADVTIAPEDPRARELSALIKSDGKPSGILERTAKGELSEVVFSSYARLAEGYIEQGNYEQAQVVYERILVLRLNELGPTSPRLIPDLRNLAGALCTQGKFDQAEPFARRALAIEEREQTDALALADALSFLSSIYLRQEKLIECEPLLKRALEIQETHLDSTDMHIADTLSDYARLLQKTDRKEEAEELYARAKTIAANQLDDW